MGFVKKWKSFYCLYWQIWKDNNPSSRDLFSLGTWVIHLLRDSYNTGQNWFDWNSSKIASAFSCADYFQAKDLHELHLGRSMDYLFPLKFSGYLLLENSNIVTRILEIRDILNDVSCEKSLQSMTKDLFKYKNLSLTIISDIESLLVLSQAERPLLVFFCVKSQKKLLYLYCRGLPNQRYLEIL